MHTLARCARRKSNSGDSTKLDQKGETQYTWVHLYTHRNLTYRLLVRNLAGTAMSGISGVALIATHPSTGNNTDKTVRSDLLTITELS